MNYLLYSNPNPNPIQRKPLLDQVASLGAAPRGGVGLHFYKSPNVTNPSVA